MRRRRYPTAAAILDATIASKPKPQRKLASVAKCAEEVDVMRTSDDWSRATPKHIVALFAWLHREVYQVDDADLAVTTTRLKAIGSVKRLLETEFNGEVERLVDFMRWAWKREAKSEQKRRKGGELGLANWRLTWYYLFGNRKALVDYRVELVRGMAKSR